MKLTLHWLIVLAIFSLAAVTPLSGQENSCAFALKEGQRLYQQGLIEKIPALLSPCLQNGFSRQERQDAYKLILLCYLFDDNQRAADSAMLQFLKKYPEYEINPTDPKEFVYLFDTYKNLPVLSVGVIGGLTIPQFFVKQSNSTNNLNQINRSYQKSGTSYQIGLQFNTYLADHYELGLEALYTSASFRTIDNVMLFDSVNETRTYSETQSRFEIPVFVRYNYPLTKKVIPYAYLGLSPFYTISASASVTRIYYTATATDNSSNFNVLPMRNRFGMSAFAGIGLKYHVSRGFIFVDFKYLMDLTPQLNQSYVDSQLNANPPGSPLSKLIWTYNSLTDNFRFNKMSISLGYSYIFYHPKKKHQ